MGHDTSPNDLNITELLPRVIRPNKRILFRTLRIFVELWRASLKDVHGYQDNCGDAHVLIRIQRSLFILNECAKSQDCQHLLYWKV